MASPTPKAHNIDTTTAEFLRMARLFPGDFHLGAGGLSITACRLLARSPFIASILRTRNNQQAEFQRVQEDEYALGFRIGPRDPKAKITKSIYRRIDQASRAILEGGGDWFPGGLEAATRALTVDSLTCDLAFFEILEYNPNPKARDVGEYLGFVPVDPLYIRRFADEADLDRRQWFLRSQGPAFYQFIDNEVTAQWQAHEMKMCVRNPRTWAFTGSYGHPEIEELVQIIIWTSHALMSNGATYMTGLHGNKMFVLKTAMTSGRFEQVANMVHAALNGTPLNRQTPVIPLNQTLGEDLVALDMGKTSNAEMQFSDWINFLMKVTCAIFGMDSAEINFLYGNEVEQTKAFQDSPLNRVVASKERGLRPYMRSLGRWIDDAIFKRFWPDLKFSYRGFDAQSQRDRDEADVTAVSHWMTPNEIRARRMLPPIAHPAADHPLNPMFSIQESFQPPAVVDISSPFAWVNGKQQRKRPPFSEPA